jgi:hypothetical protein
MAASDRFFDIAVRAASGRLYEIVMCREQRELDPGGRTNLVEDVRDVPLDRVLAD